MAHNCRPRLDPDNVPPAKNGLPRVYPPGSFGRPSYDWDAIIPEILAHIEEGVPVQRALKTLGLGSHKGVFARLTSPQWRAQYDAASRAGAHARVDRDHERLLDLAEAGPGEIKREQIDAARWAAEHGKWYAERRDNETFGREDRLKVATVSAVRIVVETPPNAAMLPALQDVTELPTASAVRVLGDGGE